MTHRRPEPADPPQHRARARPARLHAPAGSCSRRCWPRSEPLTAEEIAGGADLASTYRNLETLETIGIVRHVHLGHGPGRYELSGRSAGWATCEACGRSTPLPSPALQAIRSRCARPPASRPPSGTSRSSGAARTAART